MIDYPKKVMSIFKSDLQVHGGVKLVLLAKTSPLSEMMLSCKLVYNSVFNFRSFPCLCYVGTLISLTKRLLRFGRWTSNHKIRFSTFISNCSTLISTWSLLNVSEKLNDIKGVIRSRKSKDRRCNGQKKKTNNDLQN